MYIFVYVFLLPTKILFKPNDCAPSEDSDQPGHPPSLIGVFAVRMKKAWVLSYPLSALQILWSDWADAQADLSLHWAQSHFVGFDMRWLIYQLLQWIVGYCKNPKNSDTRKVCGNHHKIQTRWLYRKVMHPKDAAGMVNSVDPDVGAVWSGSTLFAQAYLSANLGDLRY